jgi:hypothetical protein
MAPALPDTGSADRHLDSSGTYVAFAGLPAHLVQGTCFLLVKGARRGVTRGTARGTLGIAIRLRPATTEFLPAGT